jgi:pentatricopeptide repeat protein
MHIRVLGPLEVTDSDGRAVHVAGARLRSLLMTLALTPGRIIPSTDLVDAIWGEEPPAGAANALQALVSRLRRALPDAVIEANPAGYRLVIDPDAVDVIRFERLVEAGRAELADQPAPAARMLGEALELWRGPALVDVAQEEFFRPSVTRLEEFRLTATEDRAEAILRLGRGAELITELTQLVAENPLREQLVGALMRALGQAGRPAEALAVYERARHVLADELGADPSPELSALHTELLRGRLDTTPTPEPTIGTMSRTNLRLWLTSFVGREPTSPG